ncbi:MAG: class I SAM-dependent methyltransferase [Patescibacteria group bacterium]
MKRLEREPQIPESTDEEVFQSYVEDLRLVPEDFDKKIIDIGAGSTKFAKWAKEHGISREIYSLEPQEESILEKNKSVTALAEAIPFENGSFDLVISRAAIPNVYEGEVNTETVREKVINSLSEMVRITRPGGEVRLSRVLIQQEHKPQYVLPPDIEEALESLKEKYDVEIEKIRIPSDDIYQRENHQLIKLLAESYLIIIRKPIKDE